MIEPCRELVIATSSGLLAAGVQQALPDVTCRLLNGDGPVVASSPPGAGYLLINPVSWEEVQRWRPSLQRMFGKSSWLVLAELRVAGAFLSYLPERCALLPPSVSPEALQTALRLLKRNGLPSPSWALQKYFINGASELPD